MIPDTKTILELQKGYTAAIVAAGRLSAEDSASLATLRGGHGSPHDLHALAAELMPVTNFRVDDVNWSTEWDPTTRELRHNGVVVRLES